MVKAEYSPKSASVDAGGTGPPQPQLEHARHVADRYEALEEPSHAYRALSSFAADFGAPILSLASNPPASAAL